MIVGITGNIGAGKSTFSGFIELAGFKVLDADKIAKELLKKGSPAYWPVISAFGDAILSAEGEIDRKKLADVVFSDKRALEKLTEITHPMVEREILSVAKKETLTFVEAAVLIEAGWYRIVDKIVVVFAHRGQRYFRASRKFALQDVIKRDSFQLPYREKLKFADFLICNTKSLLDLKLQTDLFLRELLSAYMVGAGGFEPPTSWSRTKRATRLRHAPIAY